MKRSGKVIYSYDDPIEFGINEQKVEEQAPHMDADMVDTHLDDDNDWQHGVAEHENP